MNDADIQVFITGARRYFESIDASPVMVIEPPFIKDRAFLEYTGIIGISGKAHGAVCFTASSSMLFSILTLLKDERLDEAAKRDLVGEIANTLSGNAREEFGNEFLISIPVVASGQQITFDFPSDIRNYVIPLSWHSQTAYLLVCLE
ncbi:MAG: chemotaxis protein CheX [Chthoniobacterales bacterium]|jgi:chemotaxis protein CheX